MRWVKVVAFVLMVAMLYSIVAALLHLGDVGAALSPLVGIGAMLYAMERWAS